MFILSFPKTQCVFYTYGHISSAQGPPVASGYHVSATPVQGAKENLPKKETFSWDPKEEEKVRR